MVKDIYVGVYRHAGRQDCTNGGITSLYSHLHLYDGDRDECIAHAKKFKQEKRSLYLVRRILWGEKHYYAEPLIEPDIKGPHMFGGNFVYSSCGDFSDMLGRNGDTPLPVHDRYETWEMYEALSV